MTWTKPDFIEISLCMEVTAYVNTDDRLVVRGSSFVAKEEPSVAFPCNEQRTTNN